MDGGYEVIHPPSERKALEWITALAAAGLAYRLVKEGADWRLWVPANERDRAWVAISEYEEANVGWPPRPTRTFEPRALAHPLWSGLWGSGLILIVFLSFGPYDAANPWLRAAASDSVAIREGQWWRPVTALTLHGGFAHVAGNAIFLTILGGAACRTFGIGLAWTLILLSGIAGNLLTAWAASDTHIAVGASTASFGALGLIAAYQAMSKYRATGQWKSVWSRVWIPLCGGLAMLGFLGTAPDSDLVAHGFGFLAGMVIAVPFGRMPRLRLSETWDALLRIAAIALIMMAWRAAIRFAGG